MSSGRGPISCQWPFHLNHDDDDHHTLSLGEIVWMIDGWMDGGMLYGGCLSCQLSFHLNHQHHQHHLSLGKKPMDERWMDVVW
jgi:hypothetical protein